LQLSWCSSNYADGARRAIGLAWATSFNNIGGFISGQIYRDNDKPYYVRGHSICACLCAVGAVAALAMRWHLARENRKRDGMTEKQREGRVHIEGDWNPDYRYVI